MAECDLGRQWACFAAGGDRMVRQVSPSLFCIAGRHRDETADHCGKAQARKELIEVAASLIRCCARRCFGSLADSS
jgi:hypothetical protein